MAYSNCFTFTVAFLMKAIFSFNNGPQNLNTLCSLVVVLWDNDSVFACL